MMDIEPCYISNNTICNTIFGKIDMYYKTENEWKPYKLNNIKVTCKLHFDTKNKLYTLHVPKKIDFDPLECKRKVISLDPGIRCFMTGISDDEVIKIGGKEVYDKIEKYLKRIDIVKNKKTVPKKKKKKVETLCNRKIKNYVNELHWKTIDYLIGRYDNILVGNLSAKGISSKKTSNIPDIVKRIGYSLSFYKFRTRLQYKCLIHKIGLKVVDESYTSKCCSKCGNYKQDLGASKLYECKKCKKTIDRDVNGARGICMVSVIGDLTSGQNSGRT
jgi:IS605 OrfB family transposase